MCSRKVTPTELGVAIQKNRRKSVKDCSTQASSKRLSIQFEQPVVWKIIAANTSIPSAPYRRRRIRTL